ncbi:MAG: hypothetical protein KF809_13240 [Chloroflexi bacterium]|nr:hypothetical protein [Chloroflexota bacterium]
MRHDDDATDDRSPEEDAGAMTNPQPGSGAKELVTDHLEAIGLVRASAFEREELLERVGDQGPVEQDIVAEIEEGRSSVLHDPAAFPPAHRATLRSLEVLERNGGRPPTLGGLGPLTPVAVVLVGMLTRSIVRAYLMLIVGRLETLYGFRAAAATPGTEERAELRRAYREVHLVALDLRGTGRGILALIAGGVVLSTLASVTLGVARAAVRDWVVAILVLVVLFGGMLAFSWCALMAAAVARRRIRLGCEAEVGRLYQAIGGCGEPPRDRSVELALGATALMVVAWILVPIVLSVTVAGGLGW